MRSDTKVPLATSLDEHYQAMRGVDRVVVLAFHSLYLGAHVPNDYVADYVKRDPQKLIGFMSIDPNDPGAVPEMERAFFDLGLRGMKMSPIYQNYAPMDPRAQPIYRFAQEHHLPLLVHSATTFPRTAPLKFASPILMEDVAIAYPDLVIILAHLGHPWAADTMAIIRKQPNVYADLSGLHYRPWQLYNFLMLCHEWGVMDKLLYASDYPVATPEETIKGLLGVNAVLGGAPLPQVPLEAVEKIIYRDPLPLLGLA